MFGSADHDLFFFDFFQVSALLESTEKKITPQFMVLLARCFAMSIDMVVSQDHPQKVHLVGKPFILGAPFWSANELDVDF